MAPMHADGSGYPVFNAGVNSTTSPAHESGQGARASQTTRSSPLRPRQSAVVTFNRRHLSVYAEVTSHAGIIVCTRDDDVVALADAQFITSSRIPRHCRISCYGSIAPVHKMYADRL